MTQSQSQLRTVEYPLEGMEGKTVVDMKCRHLLGSIRVDIGGTSHEIRRFLLGTEDHVAGIVEIAFQSGGGVILQGYSFSGEGKDDWTVFYYKFTKHAENHAWSKRKCTDMLMDCLIGRALNYAIRLNEPKYKTLLRNDMMGVRQLSHNSSGPNRFTMRYTRASSPHSSPLSNPSGIPATKTPAGTAELVSQFAAAVERILAKSQIGTLPRGRSPVRNDLCYRCNQPGHFIRECLQAGRPPSAEKHSSEKVQSVPEVNHTLNK